VAGLVEQVAAEPGVVQGDGGVLGDGLQQAQLDGVEPVAGGHHDQPARPGRAGQRRRDAVAGRAPPRRVEEPPWPATLQGDGDAAQPGDPGRGRLVDLGGLGQRLGVAGPGPRPERARPGQGAVQVVQEQDLGRVGPEQLDQGEGQLAQERVGPGRLGEDGRAGPGRRPQPGHGRGEQLQLVGRDRGRAPAGRPGGSSRRRARHEAEQCRDRQSGATVAGVPHPHVLFVRLRRCSSLVVPIGRFPVRTRGQRASASAYTRA
jgi:hypothetical protein